MSRYLRAGGRQPREALRRRVCADRAAGALVAARRAQPGDVSDRLGLLQIELLKALRAESSRFNVSVPRNQAMWKKLGEIPEQAWADANDMPGAQVAEMTYRPEGWKAEPLRLIVRRVAFTASEIAKRKGSRRLKTIHPEQGLWLQPH